MRRSASLMLTAALVLTGPRALFADTPKKVADAPYPVEFQARVRKAIEKGLVYLRTQQLRVWSLGQGAAPQDIDAVDFPEAAAVTRVLRRAGVDPQDPARDKAETRLRARTPRTIEEASVLLTALCARPLPQGNPFPIEGATNAAAGKIALTQDERALVESAAKFLRGKQVVEGGPFWKSLGRDWDPAGGWGGEVDERDRSRGILATADIPTTYLALLGLEAAARAGVTVPAAVHAAALRLLLGWQAPKGPTMSLLMNRVAGAERSEWTVRAHARGYGWVGSWSDGPSGHETVAGALGLVICQDALEGELAFTKELRKSTASAVCDALAWVQQNYDIKQNPIPAGVRARNDISGPRYRDQWLQGLARLAIHARMRFLGTHDWFQEGAEALLSTQHADGSWGVDCLPNCHSLLFLLRASLSSIAPVVTVTEGEPGR